MPPPTRREQAQLDELLSDIYRGIETLPDRSHYQQPQQQQQLIYGNRSAQQAAEALHQSPRSYTSQVKEYELPGSAPLVKHHKQEIAKLQAANGGGVGGSGGPKPHRSTLKRNTTNTPESPAQAQSLASFVISTTPENRRRVRIVDPNEKGYSSDEGASNKHQHHHHHKGRVKYVNTNKLIYHQERNPDDDDADADEADEVASSSNNNNNKREQAEEEEDEEDDDDIDGVTRVEYYHTSWLDRQLGRASKRRSSKELNERQVKEKAMIEELKRSLKNGAITLRQSFRGKRQHKNKPSETYDDQVLDTNHFDRHHHNNKHHHQSSSVFGSGLATIPRNHNSNNYTPKTAAKSSFFSEQTPSSKQEVGNNNNNIYTNNKNNNKNPKTAPTPKQTSDYLQQQQQQQQTVAPSNFTSNQSHQSNYSRTLPHNYHQQQPQSHHQLLQSHYSGNKTAAAATTTAPNYNTIGHSAWSSQPQQQPPAHSSIDNGSNMRQPNYNNSCLQQQQQQPPLGNTISSIPSATEVVRSALSRSGSQVSLNQLNKTINLLPNSPPPFGASPAATPTQQLKAASPSLSPSPIGGYQRQNSDLTGYCQSPRPNTQYSSKTMGNIGSNSQVVRGNEPQQQRLYGSRLVPAAPSANQQQQQQQQYHRAPQAPVYANPHASLMQHRSNQMNSATAPGRSTNSIREFNELDNLLRSLSPQGSVQVTPGFTTKPAQPAFGYGYAPPATAAAAPAVAAPAHQQQQVPFRQQPAPNSQSVIYASVQKHQQPQPQPQHQTHDPYVIDASDKREADCLQRQELSEFEPKIELVPSMEDYQNISKLNPVKNHYWYKPNMSRDRAISLLKDKPQGTFIVRDSTSFKNAYGLAVKVAKLPKNVHRNPNADPSAELIRHFLIEPTSNGVKLKGYPDEPVFGSLTALIYQHSLTEIALPCKLLIPRTDIEDPQFNLKQKQFFDEFVASKEQAKHQPYERTSPDGGYRRYPGNVLIANEHRIIFQ